VDKGVPLYGHNLLSTAYSHLKETLRKVGVPANLIEGGNDYMPPGLENLDEAADWARGMIQRRPRLAPYFNAYLKALSRSTAPAAGTPPSRNSRKGKPRKYNAFQHPAPVGRGSLNPPVPQAGYSTPEMDQDVALDELVTPHSNWMTHQTGHEHGVAQPELSALLSISAHGRGESGRLAKSVLSGDFDSIVPLIDALAEDGYPEEVIYAVMGLGDAMADRAHRRSSHSQADPLPDQGRGSRMRQHLFGQ
jgi:hypothetical protein